MSSNFFYPSILGPSPQLSLPPAKPTVTLDKLAALQNKLAMDSRLVTAVAVLRAKYALADDTPAGYASGLFEPQKHRR